MKRHLNIPIFIPHLGCPNQCVFCNQRSISGIKEFQADSVISVIESSLRTAGPEDSVEIAFFGGSFTGIDRELMIRLLSIAKGYIDKRRVDSVRCSTRPDYINEEILGILKSYGVKTVELGLQSSSPGVLEICKRGHSLEDEINACRMITEAGFVLGGQMMIGLPNSCIEDEIKTAEFIVKSGAREARIYPTVVFKNTELYDMSNQGTYEPLSIDDAVERSAAAFRILHNGGVKVLRIGLCDSKNLHSEETYYSGPNHPAIGELVENRLYLDLIKERINGIEINPGCVMTVYAPRGHISKVIGQNQMNKKRLMNELGLSSFKVKETDALSPYNILLDIQERK